jgi:hypothetical protein
VSVWFTLSALYEHTERYSSSSSFLISFLEPKESQVYCGRNQCESSAPCAKCLQLLCLSWLSCQPDSNSIATLVHAHSTNTGFYDVRFAKPQKGKQNTPTQLDRKADHLLVRDPPPPPHTHTHTHLRSCHATIVVVLHCRTPTAESL